MQATDLSRGDWIKRDGHEFQVRSVRDGRVYIGNSGQSYSLDRVNALLNREDVEVVKDTGINERPGTGWA